MPLSRIHFKTWIELDASAFRANVRTIRGLLARRAGLWIVVKSNAYGHGLVHMSVLAQESGVDGFCVDSVIEGGRLREAGIVKPILALGPTLPHLFAPAAERRILLTIAGREYLDALGRSPAKPEFHLKIDSGMHRQGFYPEEIPNIAQRIRGRGLAPRLKGAYTHFAAAKDPTYQAYTKIQFKKFSAAAAALKKSGALGKSALLHCAASGAAYLDRRYHLDLVRVGIGLYGLWPSKELELQLGGRLVFKPVLSWRSIISEIKTAEKGAFVGYDMSERLAGKSKLAIVPIGYWHGFDRGLSGKGDVLVNGRRARVRGRVSMDMIIVDVTGIPCRVGDTVTLIGRDGREEIKAGELAARIDTTAYEVLTRINPLIKKLVI
ncbi:MAG: alanine racemase [Candidatus Aminicenantales bacterium]|jgi:alanine racemase